MAQALGITARTVEHLKDRFVEQGIEAALQRKPRAKPPKISFDGAFDAQLTALACSPAPDGRARWTVRLLAEKVVELKIHEYVRNGVAEIFLEVEPLSGRRHVDITQQRTRKDWAIFIKGMLDERYAQYLSNRRFGLRLFRKTLTMVHA